jgi:hypothetical protein
MARVVTCSVPVRRPDTCGINWGQVLRPVGELDPFTRRLLYGPSRLSPGQRELIAAFVSHQRYADSETER